LQICNFTAILIEAMVVGVIVSKRKIKKLWISADYLHFDASVENRLVKRLVAFGDEIELGNDPYEANIKQFEDFIRQRFDVSKNVTSKLSKLIQDRKLNPGKPPFTVVSITPGPIARKGRFLGSRRAIPLADPVVPFDDEPPANKRPKKSTHNLTIYHPHR
jgi:hypothetical protein